MPRLKVRPIIGGEVKEMPTTRKRMGRPIKHAEGTATVTVRLPKPLLDDLARFTAQLTLDDGKRRSYGEVLVTTLSAYPPFRKWRSARASKRTA